MTFDEDELKGLQAAELQRKSQEIKQRFDQKRSYFHQIRNHFIVVEHWDDLNQKLVAFDMEKFNVWNKQWNNVHRSVKPEELIKYFNAGEVVFSEFSDYLSSILPKSDEVELTEYKNEILAQIKEELNDLTAAVNGKVKEGIDDVIGLKSELGLEKNFGENIETELKASIKSKNNFRNLFIGTLALIPVFLALSSHLFSLDSSQQIELITLKLGVSFSLGFLSYFFFSQYKVYQMMSLRYSHLTGFLGGGATFLSRLVNTEDGEIKKDINRKIAHLFMQNDDISGLVKKTTHPADVSIDKLGKLLEQIGKFNKT
ncbi:hypothetical protein OAG1_21110 [Agarivorans sp. OAG1]|uniref:hypothetical protein n=1 Tax=Agarivorans sp. OAG1 TaxID=3082387 RepID=UPI002B2A6C39|nr:hypothetical protein OAG1_21110 [Agarivorans sp. OAG1]